MQPRKHAAHFYEAAFTCVIVTCADSMLQALYKKTKIKRPAQTQIEGKGGRVEQKVSTEVEKDFSEQFETAIAQHFMQYSVNRNMHHVVRPEDNATSQACCAFLRSSIHLRNSHVRGLYVAGPLQENEDKKACPNPNPASQLLLGRDMGPKEPWEGQRYLTGTHHLRNKMFGQFTRIRLRKLGEETTF